MTSDSVFVKRRNRGGHRFCRCRRTHAGLWTVRPKSRDPVGRSGDLYRVPYNDCPKARLPPGRRRSPTANAAVPLQACCLWRDADPATPWYPCPAGSRPSGGRTGCPPNLRASEALFPARLPTGADKLGRSPHNRTTLWRHNALPGSNRRAKLNISFAILMPANGQA